MTYSSFDGGFAGGVLIRGVPLLQTNPGQVFWVNNSGVLAVGERGGSDGNKGTFLSPFATLDKAMSATTANRGDIVFIKPGHNESEAAANGAIADIDVAGVAVVGLGSGDLRPTFDLDVATATFDITAANTTISNVILNASVTIVAVGFDVKAKNVLIDRVTFAEELAGTDEFVDCIDTSATDGNSDGLKVNECIYLSTSTSNEAFIQVNGDLDGLEMTNCRVSLGVNDDECFVGVSTITDTLLNMYIANNDLLRLNTDGELIMEGTANDCTGWIIRNLLRHADVAAALLIPVGSNIALAENYLSEAIDVSGFILPVIGNDA